MKTVLEPFRIKTVEPFRITSEPERTALLAAAHHNLFLLRAEDVMIDLLTDSGTGAMSTQQWAAIMTGDESYAGCRSFYELEATVRELTGYRHVFPVHQGRAAERILFGALLVPGQSVPNNTHFDTTRANIEYLGAAAVDFVAPHGRDLHDGALWKGDLDVARLSAWLASRPKGSVPLGLLTITNNCVGGQPVSMQNLRDVSALYRRHGIPFFLDAARFAENAWWIHRLDPEWQNVPLPKVVRAMFDLADGCLVSAKKDGLVNMGGLLCVNDDAIASKVRNLLILTEGFPTYGGLAGRDLAALAQGLREVLDPDYQSYREASARYFAQHLAQLGVPVVRPVALHAVYVDARAMLPHIPPHELPGQALACALYERGGVRSVEIGTLMFGRHDAAANRPVAADHDLVRLCLPRRVYTQSHVDWVIETFAEVHARRERLRGFTIVEQPPFLRAFTAKLRPVAQSVGPAAPANPAASPRADKKTCGCACSAGHPVDELSAEHRTIRAVIGAIRHEARALSDGAPVRQPFWLDVLEFIENYADRCHHAKEETLLFAELERAGLPVQHGPTACLRSEHETGRAWRTAMAQAMVQQDAMALADAATAWCDLLLQHIRKEDQVLFPMAKDMLDHAAVHRLREGFANVEREVMGEGTHCRFEELGLRLASEDPAATV